MDHKLNRLKDHVGFLSSLLGRKAEAIPETYESYIQEKFRLMKELRVASMMKSDEIITNKRDNYFPDLPFFKKIISGYSGQDLHMETDPDDDFFYPEKGISFFTKSGQSAIISALLFLYENFPGITFKTSQKIYHEAEDILGTLKIISNNENGIKASYIDSANFDVTSENLRQLLADSEWAVIDSTCWEMRSPEMRKITECLNQENIPALIVRSHVKLDSLGAEYGLLGSIFLVPARLEEKDLIDYTAKIKKKIAITRASADPTDLYPFWVKGVFAKLTNERTKDIRANTRFIEDYLSEHLKDKLSLKSFPHALFCMLELPFKGNLKEQLRKIGLLGENTFLVCGSFGFDQLNITYVDSPHEADKCALRFSGSDLPPEVLSDRLRLICILLQKLYP